MTFSGGYNREKTWEEQYRKFGEEKSGEQDGERDLRTFAEMFEARGMKGFKPEEKAERRKCFESTGRRYPENPESSLDLHGHTTEEAKVLLDRFIQESREMGHIFVIVVTGIGRNSEGGVSKLRPIVVEKLNQMMKNHLVREYCTAALRHGGFGAIYVYLK